MVTAAMKLKDTPWKESYDQPRQNIKKQSHYFVNQGPASQGYGFSNSPVQMWELDYKESWVPKNWCFWTVVLEKTPDQFMLKEISPGCSLERLMLKLKLQYFGHLMWRADSLENTMMLGKIEGRRRRGWQRMRWLDGITDSMDMSLGKLGVGDGQEGLACCTPWGRKESDMTERLNWLTDADETTLRTESEEELKSLLMKVKEESEKAGLKLNTEKTKIIASGPITSR